MFVSKFSGFTSLILNLHRHDDPFEITHWPLLDTLLHVAFCGPLYGTVLHLNPAVQLTVMFSPSTGSDGIVYVYCPEIVDPLQSTSRCKKKCVKNNCTKILINL